MSLKKSLKDYANNYLKLDPQKRKLVTYLVLIFLIIVVMIFMSFEKKKTVKEKKEETKLENIIPDVKILQKSLYHETTKKTEDLEKRMQSLEKKLSVYQQLLKKKTEEQNKILEELNSVKKILESKQTAIQKEDKKVIKKDFSARPLQHRTIPPPIVTNQDQKKKVIPQWVGGIGEVKNTSLLNLNKKASEEEKIQKKKEPEVYLPPSFVSADLLNGFAAFTSNQGKQEPVRVFLRLRDLAVLPNEVKSDLKGCFVIGEAYGNLADERAHVRLLRLSCIARDGKSVIDSSVKGWVVDEDGRTGLKGRVVAKMGSFLVRSMLAGFLEGFGEAYGESNYNITTSGGSIVQLPSPENAAKIGIGKGIAKAGSGLSKFYLELARQTLPVIEVGAGKRVTVVFTEGVNLKIKKTCLTGRNGCLEKKSNLSVLNVYFGS